MITDNSTLPLLLKQLQLKTIANQWQVLTEQACTNGWTYPQFLTRLCEQECAYRAQQRTERLLKEAHLPAGKTLSSFSFESAPQIKAPQIQTLAQQTQWVDQAENLLFFGPSGVGKTHLAAAIAHGLAALGKPVRFFNAAALVQYLQTAKKELLLEKALFKLDRYRLLIIDDMGYVKKSEQETSVLFQLIVHRYETGSILITSNQPFSQWDNIFADPIMAVAASDRLVHHSTIIEITGESYRKQSSILRRDTMV